MDTDIREVDIQAEREARLREQYRIIGRKIAYYRRLQGYTQAQLAERSSITANYLSQIECGKREKYPLHTLMLIADALGVELRSLCG